MLDCTKENSKTKSSSKSLTSKKQSISPWRIKNSNKFLFSSLKKQDPFGKILSFCKKHDITQRHIENWVKEFGITAGEIFKYIEYLYYDITELRKVVNSPVNYLYKVIKVAEAYSKPRSFKSQYDLQGEQDAIVRNEKKQARIKEDEEKLEQAIKTETAFDQEHSEEFENMMSEPNSEKFKQCFSKINDCAKMIWKRFKNPDRPAFRACMSVAFNESKRNGF